MRHINTCCFASQILIAENSAKIVYMLKKGACEMIKKDKAEICPIKLNDDFEAGVIKAEDMSWPAVSILIAHHREKQLPVPAALSTRQHSLRRCY